MDNIRGIVLYIRSLLFQGAEPSIASRKRRANDTFDFENYNYSSPTKSMRLSNYTPMAKQSPGERHTSRRHADIYDPIVIDDEPTSKPTKKAVRSNMFRVTSTPNEPRTINLTNGDNHCDDVSFVREFKSPIQLNSTRNKKSPLETGTKPKQIFANRSRRNGTSSSLDYSFRLDDKMQYKKLLDSYDNSTYFSAVGSGLNSSSFKSPKNTSPLDKSDPKERLSTRDRMLKVLGGFNNEPVVVPDSDSESDVIISPPSPKPDFKVDPVNSLKTIVDTTVQSTPKWLEKLLSQHTQRIEERKQELIGITESADRHSQINKDLRVGLLANKINKSLTFKDDVLPVIEIQEDAELPVLTPEQYTMVKRAFQGDLNEVLVKKFNLNITRRDLLTLSDLNWLNDEIINFYMNLIIERGKNSNGPKVYAMNTFFYSKLIKDGAQSLRRWTKRVDLFSYDLLCVPIHLGLHWCMAIVDFRNTAIQYFDSMGADNDRCLNALRYYLQAEHLDKKRTTFDTSKWDLENVENIPQQMNGSDCGVFSCMFAEYISRGAALTFSQDDMPYLRNKMVVEIMSGELLIQ